MKNFLLLITCLLVCGTAIAQKKFSIYGQVKDQKGEVLPYALIKLLKYADTTLVKSVEAKLDGSFAFNEVEPGSYVIFITLIGYQRQKTEKFTVAIDDVKLPAIKLETTTKVLKEVVIESKKNFVEQRIDKTVLNIENSILATGGTALEILEKAPGVIVDKQNDQILLHNKAGTTVMIDGKNNFLSAADLTAYLNNLNSSQIATIEIITNPSAKFDAAGNAGIINIKLRKNKNFGTNGGLSSVYRNAMQPNLPRNVYGTELNFNLNNRDNKWNFFSNINVSKNNNFNRLQLDRTSQLGGVASIFNQDFKKIYTGSRLGGKLGADYFLTDKTTLGVMLDGSTNTRKLENISQTFIEELSGGNSNKNSLVQNSDANTPNKNYTINFNMKHNLKKEGASLNFDADYSGFDYEGLESFSTNFFNDNKLLDSNTLLKNDSKTNIAIYAAKTDFTWPLSKTVNLEAGLKSSFVTTKNDFLASKQLNNAWENIAGQSNVFNYKENINAAYFNLAKDWGKWQVQFGLRSEYTNAKGTSVTNNSTAKNNYLSVFPTVFVNQKISDNHNMRYSYGRRIDRPNYQQLNPFNFFMDPYTIQQGNPYLKPQFTDNFSIAYSYKTGLSFSINYANTRDLILNSKTAQNDTTRIVTVGQGNIGSGQNYSANLYFPLKLAKWWNLQSNFSVFYNKFNDDNLEGAPFQLAKVAYNFNISSSITLPKNWSVETNYWFNSPRVRGLERTTIYQHALNIGMQKSIMAKMLKFKLNVDDIFLTNYWKGALQYQNVNLSVQNNYISRRASFSVSYSFGNQSVKSARDRNTATEDIKRRAGN